MAKKMMLSYDNDGAIFMGATHAWDMWTKIQLGLNF